MLLYITIIAVLLFVAYKSTVYILQNTTYYKGKPISNFKNGVFITAHNRGQPNQFVIQEVKDNPQVTQQLDFSNKRKFSFLLQMLLGKAPKVEAKNLPTIQKSIPKQRVMDDSVEVYLINHSTVLIQTKGLNIITDPVYSNKVGPYNAVGTKRLHPPAIDFNNLPPIDVILLSHNHYDHMDLRTILKLFKKFNPTIITPLGNDYFLKKLNKHIKVITLNWNESTTYKGFNFYVHKAYHWSKRGLYDTNKALWGSFVIETGSKNIYFAGDTAFADGEIFYEIANTHKQIDLALLPIGAYKPIQWRGSHTNPLEAVEIFKRINAKNALAIHTGTFVLSFETYPESVEDLRKATQQYGLSSTAFIAPVLGKMYKY